MKHTVLLAAVAVATIAALLIPVNGAPRHANVSAENRELLLIRDLTVEPEVFEKTVAYVKENVQFTVKALDAASSLAQESSEKQFESLKNIIAANSTERQMAVALVREAADIKERILLVRDQSVGVVNLTQLQPEIRGTKDEGEQFRRLIQKETLRTAGYLMGLSQCFNPRCAMSGYRLDPGQDVMGRNYCPACRMKIEGILSGKEPQADNSEPTLDE